MNIPFLHREEEPDDTSFPQLVFAHYLRQRELYSAAYDGAPSADRTLRGPAEEEYQRKLAAFTKRNGRILDAYWCTHEISAVALTARAVWGWRGLWPHRGLVTHLHGATDWATRHSQEISSQLHACESLAIRANEVLLGTSERIVMQLLMSQSARLLAVVDRENAPPPAAVAKAVKESQAQLAEIRSYYDRAGQKAVRIFYVGGMLAGLALLGIALLVLWSGGSGDHVLAAVAMGGVGAVVSVLSRMANRDSRFHLDHEVGQKEARRLGAFRPFIGATFGAVLYLAIASDLVSLGALTPKERTLPFYAVVAFLAGFSERWAKVVLDLAPPAAEPKRTPQPRAAEAAETEEVPEAPIASSSTTT
jgi:hypothetical protein